MSWNYRVIRSENSDGAVWLGICEVYYDEDGTPSSRTDIPKVVSDDAEPSALDQMRSTLKMMLKALDKPVLDDFVNSEAPDEPQ